VDALYIYQSMYLMRPFRSHSIISWRARQRVSPMAYR